MQMILMKNCADLLCSVNSALDTAVVCELTEFSLSVGKDVLSAFFPTICS